MYCTVISCDMDKLGQLPPRHKVKFKKISIEEAYEARKQYQAKLQKVKDLLGY
ncbi:hypothetical protein N4T57_00530 [Campylobacter hepaticus]|nr:hypothetical protein [Campylobacter hepaticus]MCZ0771663.1 hypothetical protein [Campylobacter hepaticus]MCZ0773132.1 hypothetical protein [Campylobacter hepaticus]MCZ0775811.1 hypothetical protein [Campylobacter hepaticus]WAP49528.1 hypothetical protein N3Z98_07235 [Campylobacter hepaticus]